MAVNHDDQSSNLKNILNDISSHLNNSNNNPFQSSFFPKMKTAETSGNEATGNYHSDGSGGGSPSKINPMNTAEFRLRGKQMVEYIAGYMETIQTRRVTPNVEPGYLRSYLPESAPLKAESWDSIMDDFENFIMPGVTHWQHPRFHAYFPAGNSYPSILADMLSDGIGCVGFSWVSVWEGSFLGNFNI